MTRPAPTRAEFDVRLRDVRAGDVALFFEHQLDPEASRMAAFTAEDPTDRAAFEARWERILTDEGIRKRTVLAGDEVVGHVVAFPREGRRLVGYWIARSHWGRGVATRALSSLLAEERERPLFACAAKDNAGSLRVLAKCGFRVVDELVSFANARGSLTAEVVLELEEGAEHDEDTRRDR